MNSLITIERIKEIYMTITLLIFVFHILLWQSFQTNLLSGTIQNSITDFTFIPIQHTALNQVKDSRQNLEIKTTTYDCACKNIAAETIYFTNCNKISFGRIATLKRYCNFLTTQFSTST